MGKKKILAVVLIILVLVAFLTGCTPEKAIVGKWKDVRASREDIEDHIRIIKSDGTFQDYRGAEEEGDGYYEIDGYDIYFLWNSDGSRKYPFRLVAGKIRASSTDEVWFEKLSD